MKKSSNLLSENLIVPINIQALCVSKNDQNKPAFISSRIDFTNLPHSKNENQKLTLSEKILRPYLKGEISMPAGIHLHWALPDALTQGKLNKPLREYTFGELKNKIRKITDKNSIILKGLDNQLIELINLSANQNKQLKELNSDELDIINKEQSIRFLNELTNHSNLEFPVVPNTWLITRFVDDRVDLTKHWILESDYLSKEMSTSKVKPTAVVQANAQLYDEQAQSPFRYLGRVLELNDWRQQRDQSIERYNRLTAIGYGDITFASSYQNCSSVFGFHDQLTGIEQANIHYSVVGWYNNQDDDFINDINIISNQDQLNISYLVNELDNILWQINTNNQLKEINNSLYNGLIKNINWNANNNYLDDNFIKVDTIVLAPSDLEALSTLLSNNEAIPTEAQQYFLNYCQLEQSKDPEFIKKNLEIEQSLRLKRFEQIDSGRIWQVITDFNKRDNLEISIPQEIITKLAELNQIQQKYDTLLPLINSSQDQIFADWYRYIKIKSRDIRDKKGLDVNDIKQFIIDELAEHNKLKQIVDEQLRQLISSQNSLTELIINENDKITSANEQATYKFKLTSSAASKYYLPKDPTILIKGEIAKNYAGERNKVTPTNSAVALECRISSQLINFESTNNFLTNTDQLNYQDINALISEAKILAKPSDEQAKLLASLIPDIAITNWHNQANWLAHHLEWKVEYLPVKLVAGHYLADHLHTNFSFLDKQNVLQLELIAKNPLSSSNPQYYSGASLLTPSAKYNLVDKIKSYPELSQELDKISTELAKLPILSQSLNGFNELLIMRYKAPQLKIIDHQVKEDLDNFISDIRATSKQFNNFAPAYDNLFVPIQDGIICLKELRIVDVFGRYKDIKLLETEVKYPKYMQTTTIGNQEYLNLYPRIMQNSRLSFRLLSTTNRTPNELDQQSNVNPITGWLMTNNLDNSLVFYTYNGEQIGSLKVINEQRIQWQAAPIYDQISSQYDFGQSLEETLKIVFKEEQQIDPNYINNSIICNILKNITISDNSQYLIDLMEVINQAIAHITPNKYSNSFANAYLFGRPLAIVEADIKIELQGLPVLDLSLKSFDQEIKQNEIIKRNNNQFSEVLLPIQLGDYNDFQDGLVGYFSQNDQQEINYQKFYSLTQHKLTNNISTKQQLNVSLSYLDLTAKEDKKIKKVVMLVDPRATININSGILPTKQITIPENNYLKALQNIYLTFLTSPIISEISADKMIIPVSKEDQLTWSWLEVNQTQQLKEQPIADLKSSQVFNKNQQISEGWLKLSNKL